MNAYQQKMIAEAKAKEEMTNYSEETILANRLKRIDELQMNPGDEKFAMLSGSVHLGAFRGRLDAVKWFIQKNKAQPEDLDSKGYCAIHYAAEQGHDNIIKYLLEKGCDVDVRSEGGLTALMCAAKGGRPETLRYLWDEGAVLHAKDLGGQRAAHYAAQEDNADCIETLFELCKEQIEAIHLAAELAAEENAANGLAAKTEGGDEGGGEGSDEDEEPEEPEEPLSEEAVLDSPSLNGTRPLHVAAGFDSQNVIETLLKYEFVEVNAQDRMMETALHRAARRNYFQSYAMLKEAGGDETVLNLMRETPADVLVDRSS